MAFLQLNAQRPRATFDLTLQAACVSLSHCHALEDTGADHAIPFNAIKSICSIPADGNTGALVLLHVDPPVNHLGSRTSFVTLSPAHRSTARITVTQGSGEKFYDGPTHLVLRECLQDAIGLHVVSPTASFRNPLGLSIMVKCNGTAGSIYPIPNALLFLPVSAAVDPAITKLSNIDAVSFTLDHSNPCRVAMKMYTRYSDDIYKEIHPQQYPALLSYFETHHIRVLERIDEADPEYLSHRTPICCVWNGKSAGLHLTGDMMVVLPTERSDTKYVHATKIEAVSFAMRRNTISMRVYREFAEDLFAEIHPKEYVGLVEFARKNRVNVLKHVNVMDPDFLVACGTLTEIDVEGLEQRLKYSLFAVNFSGWADSAEVLTTIETYTVEVNDVDTSIKRMNEYDPSAPIESIVMEESFIQTDSDGHIVQTVVTISEITSSLPEGAIEEPATFYTVAEPPEILAAKEVLTTVTIAEVQNEEASEAAFVTKNAPEVVESPKQDFVPPVTERGSTAVQNPSVVLDSQMEENKDQTKDQTEEQMTEGTKGDDEQIDAQNDQPVPSNVVDSSRSVLMDACVPGRNSPSNLDENEEEGIDAIETPAIVSSTQVESSHTLVEASSPKHSVDLRIRPKTVAAMPLSEKRSSRILSWIFGDKAQPESPTQASSFKPISSKDEQTSPEYGALSSAASATASRRPSLASGWKLFKRASTSNHSPGYAKPKQSPEEVSQLIQDIIDNNPAVVEVNLKDCLFLTQAQALMLAAGVSQNTVLKSLNLNNCRLNATFGIKMGEALQNNDTLESLSLERNSIGPLGIKAIATGLANNKSLVQLHLANQNLAAGFESEQALAKAISANNQITTFTANIRDHSSRGVIDRALARNSTRS
ncbi:Tropomodulin-2 [Chytriomyces hyalinus]|nr:Tropomodulin-2 [Chytriomyces hyalinus]